MRYKQTAVGVAWALIRPFLTMLILTLIGKVGKLPSGGAPYPFFAFCAMLPWQFFSSAMSDSGNSLVNNFEPDFQGVFSATHRSRQQYHHGLRGFLISSAFLVVLMLWYRFVPPATVVLLPLFILLAVAASFGVGLWVAALMVEYRDFRFIVPFVVQFGLLASPVVLMTSSVQEPWRLVYALNPMVGVIDGFRWCLLGGENVVYWPGLMLSVLGTTLLLTTGIWYFRWTERTFADVI